jgi:hypothetical protein
VDLFALALIRALALQTFHPPPTVIKSKDKQHYFQFVIVSYKAKNTLQTFTFLQLLSQATKQSN